MISAFMMVASLAAQPVTATPQAGAAAPIILDDVEVRARRGAALVAPEREYDAAAIDGLAAYDIAEAVARITERLGAREPPILIINGRKVADPAIFARFPPDALVRLEVLPPGAASLYGETSGRRVLNLVLERQFETTTGKIGTGRPTDPGSAQIQASLQYSTLSDQSALSSGIETSSTTALTIRERQGFSLRTRGDDLVTLSPGARLVAVNLSGTRPFGAWSSSFRTNLRQTRTSSATVLGQALTRYGTRSTTLSAVAGFSGDLAGWNTQATVDLDFSALRQTGLSDVRQNFRSVSANASGARNLLAMPAGDLRANLSLVIAGAESATERDVSGAAGEDRRATKTAELSGGFTLPLSRRYRPDGQRLSGMGDASLALGADLVGGDAGDGHAVNADLTWVPLDHFRLQATVDTERQPPTVQQRHAPAIYGAPTTVFDLTNGEAMQIIPIRGGNPALRNSETTVMTASLNAGPYTARALQFGLNYSRATGRDGIGVLTTPTPALEAAYPDRFIRDADGRLLMIDQRPLNLASNASETVNLNLGAGLPLPTNSGGETQLVGLSLNLTHRLTDRTDFGDGAPQIDTLAGVGGGQPRQDATFFLDTSRGRWSASVSARWQSAYRIRLAESTGPGDILVRGMTTVNLRSTVTITGQGAEQRAQGARRAGSGQIVVEIDNLFDARPSARLAGGGPAPGYGRDDRDPLGRVIRIQLSRRF